MAKWQRREKKLQNKNSTKGMQKAFKKKDTDYLQQRIKRQDIQAKLKAQDTGIGELDMEE